MTELKYEIKIIKDFCINKFEKVSNSGDVSFLHGFLAQNL